MSRFTDEEREAIAFALEQPGWYTLIRSPKAPDGYERVPCTPDPGWEEEGHDSSMISVNVKTLARRDRAVFGEMVPIVGNYHPEFLPDAKDRGEPLPE